VRVDLGGREIAMTEQHLHDAQIRTVVEEVRRERMPQRVRRELLGDAGLAGISLDDVPEGLARHAIAAAGREQVIGLALEQDLAARRARELVDPAHRFLAERNEPLAVALAEDADDALIQIHLGVAQVHQLRDTQPGGVQHLEHRAVAVAERIVHRRRAEERFDLFLGERLRQRAADLRHRDLRGRVLAHHALANEVAEEAAETGQLARGRARPGTGLHAIRDEILEVCARGAHDRHAALGEPARERRQIGPVCGERIRRKPAFHPHGIEKSRHRRVGIVGRRARGGGYCCVLGQGLSGSMTSRRSMCRRCRRGE
jgi:hypothetical protein